MKIVGYTNNGIPLCLACVDRFDLTNPAERDPEDEFLPITTDEINAQPFPIHCGSPVCHVLIGGGE
jgi:hypothetical protein